jgi:hypothetical protein
MHAVAVLKRQNLDPHGFDHKHWRRKAMGELIIVKESELNPELKPPKHGPYEKVVDKRQGKK